MVVWTDYINMHGFDFGDMCRMIKIMMSIPPNTGWIERSYSLLEIICQKKKKPDGIRNNEEPVFSGCAKAASQRLLL